MKTINYLLFTFLALTVFSCSEKSIPNTTTEEDTVKKVSAIFEISDAPYYVGNEIIFSNDSKNATSYNWDFGDGKTSKDKDPRHTYTKAGSYTIQLKAIAGDSSAIAKKTIEVLKPDPTLKAAFSVPNGVLHHKKAITFTNNSTGASSYFWEFGDGKTSAEKSPKHIFAESGDYKVTLTALDTEGNKSEAAKVIKIKKNPDELIPNFSWVGQYYQETISFKNSSKGALKYSWNFGDGKTSTAVSPIYTYVKPGTYTVTLTISDGVNEKSIQKKVNANVRLVNTSINVNSITVRSTSCCRSYTNGFVSLYVEEKTSSGGWVNIGTQENVWYQEEGTVANPKGLITEMDGNKTKVHALNKSYKILLDDYKIKTGKYRVYYRFRASVWHQDKNWGVYGSAGKNPMLNVGDGVSNFSKANKSFNSETYKTDGNRPYYISTQYSITF